ncbi:25294_t:CDS:2 [Dentiscutata erythropus]|uniref:25294_t:CDS:1 n=1 Tax=Dentiscutata erythropus TaxID=1348616 RepID=A0A9N9GRV5_9GLOM|nr:25294_t:CDS:2 [Dentiscutata erythropus]
MLERKVKMLRKSNDEKKKSNDEKKKSNDVRKSNDGEKNYDVRPSDDLHNRTWTE